MRNTNFLFPATEESQIAQLEDFVDLLMVAVSEAGFERTVEASHKTLWNAGHDLMGNSDQKLRRMGYVLALDALVRSPDAVTALVQTMHKTMLELAS